MPVVVLSDTTVLSNFAHIARQDLLRQAFPNLAATQEVRAELAAGEQLGRVPTGDWSWLAVLSLTPSEQRRAQELQRHVGMGESSPGHLSLEEADTLLDGMKERGYRSPISSLREAL